MKRVVFFPIKLFRPEIKEGKEAETEKKAEQENNESDQIEKELEKDKVCVVQKLINRYSSQEIRLCYYLMPLRTKEIFINEIVSCILLFSNRSRRKRRRT